MSGFVFVELKGLVDDAVLSAWLARAHQHVEGLPVKA
jgi:hypothetical protein